jgi:porphobilinogen synthase
MTAETRLSVDDLIAPLFVREGIDEPQPIASLPGVVQHTRESLRKEVAELAALGIPGVILFGVPSTKDADGSSAWDPNGIVQLALQDLRHEVGDELVLLADLCLDEYTDHGHCGVLVDDGTTGGVASVDNDATIELYGRVAVAQAAAGADIVAPSGMMDGQVFAIREALDEEGFDSVAILAYAAKYASALYGPFRDAVDVTIVGGGDRRVRTSPKVLTWSWSSLRSRTSMSSRALEWRSTSRSPRITYRVSTRWSWPRLRTDGSTAPRLPWSTSRPSSERVLT